MPYSIENLDSGVYRYVDSIKNLKMKVTIKKSTNVNLKLGKDSNLSDAIEMELLNENEESQGVEMRVFTWQNKVFNKKELNFYSDKSNCVSFLDHKYNDMISDLDPSNMTTYLYTYTDADYKTAYRKDFTDAEVIVKGKSSSSTLRNRRNSKFGKVPSYSKPSLPNDLMSHCKTCLQNVSKHQTMFIMADLNPNEFLEDTLLAILHVDEKGILTITPDFNSDAKPYIIQNSKLETFEYVIENVSAEISMESKQKEDEKCSQMSFKHARYLKRCVGTDFEMPDHGILKIFIMAEIVEATNFGNKSLFTYYNIDFPSGWSVPDTSWLTGITQVSKPTIKNKVYTSHFSYPIEGDAEFSINYFNFEENIIKCPVIMVEISSKDYWGCVRIEGYGYVEIPLEPGCHELIIHAWKPINTSPISKLRHHFIGSVNEINDLSYVKSFQQDEMLSRLGFRTESNGLLKLKVNVLHQSQSFLLRNEKTDLLSKLQLSSSSHSVQTVLIAFQKARNKMLSARKMLLNPQ